MAYYTETDPQVKAPFWNVRYQLYDGASAISDDNRLIAGEIGSDPDFEFSGYICGKNCNEAKVLSRAILRNLAEREPDDKKQNLQEALVSKCWEKFYREFILKNEPENSYLFSSRDVISFLKSECNFDFSEFENLDTDTTPPKVNNPPKDEQTPGQPDTKTNT